MSRIPRRVVAKKWALLAATSLAVATGPAIVPLAGVKIAQAATGEAGEAGENGEAGVALSGGSAGFLTELGYFEGTYRIVAALYLGGERDLAREHLDLSHHAFYEDIQPRMDEYGAPGFLDEHSAFAQAIADGASDEEVTASLGAVLAALDISAAASGANAWERLMSMRDLTALAFAEYEGGVDQGSVELSMEYRDSWGFFETARGRAKVMAAGDDAALKKAGAEALGHLDRAASLYPSLTSDTASADPSALAAAAGWIEIIALRAAREK